MELIQNIVEYYDELYPVTDAQKKLYEEIGKKYSNPVKFLRIGCGTGVLENFLAANGSDVTGLETFRELLDCANRRRRSQVMSIRFFQMSTLEMIRFLGKRFYNVISCLDDRILFIHDRILMRKFFFDCKELLADNGKLILQLHNYEQYDGTPVVELPEVSSIRAKLMTRIVTAEDSSSVLQQSVETGNGKILPVLKDAPVYLLHKEEITEFANEAGFTDVNFYSSYDKEPFNSDSKILIAVIG